jgi:Tfp pilus assembly protein PilX
MRTKHTSQKSSQQSQRGIALVTTLLLLLLLTAMSLTLVLSVSSDMLLTGYYRNYRGAFYAADSGLNVARQSIINSLTGAIPANFDTTKAPLGANPVATGTAAATAGIGYYASYTPINTANSWPEKVKIINVTVVPSPTQPCAVSGGLKVNGVAPTCANPTQNAASPITSYNYSFNYTISAVGQSLGSETTSVNDAGTITLVANTGLGNTTTSFAAFGMFIDQYTLCGGGDLVPGTITGPVWTNGAWNFSNGGTYTFTDKVSQVGAKAGFDNGTSCSGATTVPSGFNVNLKKGIEFSANNGSALALPTNSYSQEQAVVDGIGASPATQTSLNGALKDASGVAYPSSGTPSSGVFLPYSINASTGAKTFTGGGILVQGDAQVTLKPGNTSTAEVYTIVQGGATTTITIDPSAGSAGTTTIVTIGAPSGNGSQTINGVPQQFSPNGAPMGADTMLYVNGNITGLSGPGQGQAAINNGVALTVTAAKDISVTGDLLYAKEPVQTTGTVDTGLDSLIPGNDSGQVLGIFTAGGNVNLKNSQTSNNNLEIDASIATISQSGSGGIVNTGNAINTLTIVGGRIQNTIQNIKSTTRNVLFDQRFAGGAFSPPWFPSTVINNVGNGNTSVVSTVQRSQWINQTEYQ